MTNDIVKIKSVAASQGGETEHGLKLDSQIITYFYNGSTRSVKWILDKIFELIGGNSSAISTITTALADKEDKSNKVLSISSQSTNTQYPSALCVYQAIETFVPGSILYTNGNETATFDCNPAGSVMAYMNVQKGSIAGSIIVSIVNNQACIEIDGDKVYGSAVVEDLSGVTSSSQKIPTAGAVVLELSDKESSSNKVTSWNAQVTDDNYPSEKLVKDTLDGKVNTGFHTVQDADILDLDTVIYGDTYVLIEMQSHTIDERLTSGSSIPILFHQGYTGSEFDYAMIRVYNQTDAYLVEIAGLFNAQS